MKGVEFEKPCSKFALQIPFFLLTRWTFVLTNYNLDVNTNTGKAFVCSYGNWRKVFYKKWNFSLHMKMHLKI